MAVRDAGASHGGVAAGAWFTTPRVNRDKNKFTFGPIIEVAVLFAGIFVTIIPALLILNAWGQGHREVLGMGFDMRSPAGFYWASGVLSASSTTRPPT